MFTVGLFITPANWKHPMSPSVLNWLHTEIHPDCGILLNKEKECMRPL